MFQSGPRHDLIVHGVMRDHAKLTVNRSAIPCCCLTPPWRPQTDPTRQPQQRRLAQTPPVV